MTNGTNGNEFPNYTNRGGQVPPMPPYQQPTPPPPAPKKKHPIRNALLAGGAATVALFVAVALSSGDPANEAVDNAPKASPSATVKPTTSKPTKEAHTPAPKPPAVTETEGTGCDLDASPEEYAKCLDEWLGETATPEPTKATPSLTVSQEQAIGAAENYLEFSAFSRAGLIKQLSSKYGDGFSVKDATFAVDHIKVDWNEQAAKAAKRYLEVSHFSRSGLIKQLTSKYGDQFTRAQAEYGVKKAGL
jgi:hypothetical protein